MWTTGSWLLFEYLEQASAADRKAMEEAIARGDIAWHALPFTWQTEMLDPSMIEGSLALSQSLDQRFGKVTTGAKMTDVPGHTRGMIAPLAKHGVTFLEIGVNGGSTAAQLPPLFLWKDPSGASLTMMYHWDYSGIAVVPGSDLAVVTRVRGDNSGPHTAEEIAKIHADLAARFPNAEITACNLSEMANAIAPYRDKLPVVTEEIGDTWIHGCASDPLKVARYREVARLRERWIAKGALAGGRCDAIWHCCGMCCWRPSTRGAPTRRRGWTLTTTSRPTWRRMLDTKKYKVVEFSWIEKRQDLLDGIATLPEALREEAQLAIEGLARGVAGRCRRRRLRTARESRLRRSISLLGSMRRRARLRGCATRRRDANGRARRIRSGCSRIRRFRRKIFSASWTSYLTTKADWAQKDFGKPNIERFGAKEQDWHAESAEVHVEETDDGAPDCCWSCA